MNEVTKQGEGTKSEEGTKPADPAVNAAAAAIRELNKELDELKGKRFCDIANESAVVEKVSLSAKAPSENGINKPPSIPPPVEGKVPVVEGRIVEPKSSEVATPSTPPPVEGNVPVVQGQIVEPKSSEVATPSAPPYEPVNEEQSKVPPLTQTSTARIGGTRKKKSKKSKRTLRSMRSKKDYVVAIPSYQRPNEIVKKTLSMLKEGGVCASKVYIFVADKDEAAIYADVVPRDLYRTIVVGEKGITQQRIFITQYFPENQYVVSVDDDVEEIDRMTSSSKLEKVKDVEKFFCDGYKALKEHNLFIWGVYPVRNPFYMSHKVTTDLKFIIGVLRGFINRKSADLVPKAEVKQDYEQSILYFKKDGGVLRFNDVTVKTKFLAPGGLGSDRHAANQRAADYLEKTYPEFITQFKRATSNKKTDGMAEVKLRDRSGSKSSKSSKSSNSSNSSKSSKSSNSSSNSSGGAKNTTRRGNGMQRAEKLLNQIMGTLKIKGSNRFSRSKR